jgi:hypothetical protein
MFHSCALLKRVLYVTIYKLRIKKQYRVKAPHMLLTCYISEILIPALHVSTDLSINKQ